MYIKFKNTIVLSILLLFVSILSQCKSLSPLELSTYQDRSLRRVKIISNNFYPELSIPIIKTDNNGMVIEANKSALSIFGDIIGQDIATVFSIDSVPGSDFVSEVDTQVFKLIANANSDGIIWTGFNITDDYYDRMTKVAYRKDYYPIRLREALFFSTHDGPLSTIIIDGDYIKDINDNFGHFEGDRAIVFMAETIKESLRESDLLFHFGGDEFSIILPDTSKDEAQIVADRINQAFRDATILMAGEEYVITISLGFTTFTPSEEIITLIKGRSGSLDSISEEITRAADGALYDAKEDGKNCNRYRKLKVLP